jgi:hypothetical protein
MAELATELRPPRLYRLAEAARQFFPDDSITTRSLRKEAAAGRLQLIKIAGKHFVTAEAIQAMLERCTCHASDSHRASTSGNGQGASPNGLSVTARAKLARDAALMTWPARARRSNAI